MWVPELLFLPKIIKMLDPKKALFAPKYAFLPAHMVPCWLVGWGCGVQALSCKTPIYFINFNIQTTEKYRKNVFQGKRRGECCTPLGNDFEEKETWTPLMAPSLFPASPMEAHKATKCHLSMHNLENSRPPPETIDKKKTKQKKKGRRREP